MEMKLTGRSAEPASMREHRLNNFVAYIIFLAIAVVAQAIVFSGVIKELPESTTVTQVWVGIIGGATVCFMCGASAASIASKKAEN